MDNGCPSSDTVPYHPLMLTFFRELILSNFSVVFPEEGITYIQYRGEGRVHYTATST